MQQLPSFDADIAIKRQAAEDAGEVSNFYFVFLCNFESF